MPIVRCLPGAQHIVEDAAPQQAVLVPAACSSQVTAISEGDTSWGGFLWASGQAKGATACLAVTLRPLRSKAERKWLSPVLQS